MIKAENSPKIPGKYHAVVQKTDSDCFEISRGDRINTNEHQRKIIFEKIFEEKKVIELQMLRIIRDFLGNSR